MDHDKIKAYYDNEIEKNRLDLDHFKLEGIRSKEIISRYLTQQSQKIADIGGGAGFYAFWLQSLGHKVCLVDLSPKNIELVKQHAAKHAESLEFAAVGDATRLPFKDNEFDMALLLGPLYHLVEKEERLKAVREAKRVMRPGGVLLAAFISRYASLLDGLRRDLINDDRFEAILFDDLQNGVHVNDTGNLEYFTTAYFHTPQEMKDDLSESGLVFEKLVAVESAGWMIDNLSEKIKDKGYHTKIEKIINRIESNADLLAMSPHIIGVARKR